MPDSPFLLLTAPLERAGFRYAVTGSVASMMYGEPRFTNDVDIVLELAADAVPRFIAAYPDAEFYVPPEEVLVVEVRRAQRGHFNVIHHDTGFKADFYPVGNDALQRWALDGARRIDVEGATLAVAPPEYVVVRKLEYFREGGSQKHLADIAAMLQALDDFDRATVERHVARLGLADEWARARAFTP